MSVASQGNGGWCCLVEIPTDSLWECCTHLALLEAPGLSDKEQAEGTG